MYAQGRIAIFAGLLGLSGAAFGQGGLPLDFYVGGSVGASVANLESDDGSEFDGLGTIGGKIFGGLIFNKYFGIEGQYAHFGEAEIEDGGVASKAELTGWGFAATGNVPITERLTLVGRLGFLNWDVDTNAGDDNGLDLHAGGGFRFDVFDHFALRADWDYYPMNADGVDISTHMVSIGGQFNF